MKLLLDTHVAVWVVSDDRRLSQRARTMIADPENEKVVSVVSFWEIALKRARTPGRIPLKTSEAIAAFAEARFELLSVLAPHALTYESIVERHGDPFDRMLVAQALHEQLRLVTHDKEVARYSDTFILI